MAAQLGGDRTAGIDVRRAGRRRRCALCGCGRGRSRASAPAAADSGALDCAGLDCGGRLPDSPERSAERAGRRASRSCLRAEQGGRRLGVDRADVDDVVGILAEGADVGLLRELEFDLGAIALRRHRPQQRLSRRRAWHRTSRTAAVWRSSASTVLAALGGDAGQLRQFENVAREGRLRRDADPHGGNLVLLLQRHLLLRQLFRLAARWANSSTTSRGNPGGSPL